MLDSSTKPATDHRFAPEWTYLQPRATHLNSIKHNKKGFQSESTTPLSLGLQGASYKSCPYENLSSRKGVQTQQRPRTGSAKGAPYLGEDERDFVQFSRDPDFDKSSPLSNGIRGRNGTMTHTPSGTVVETSIESRHHRSQSLSSTGATNLLQHEKRNIPRRAPDSVFHCSHGSFCSLPGDFALDRDSKLSGRESGFSRNSCLADLPEKTSFSRRTPESSPETPSTPSGVYSKRFNNEIASQTGDKDSIDRDKIRAKQYEKLIPITRSEKSIKSSSLKRNPSGRGPLVNSVGAGWTSPGKKKTFVSLVSSPNASGRKDVNSRVQSMEGLRNVDSRPNREQSDQEAFFKSLLNKPINNIKRAESDVSTHLLQRSASESLMLSSRKNPVSKEGRNSVTSVLSMECEDDNTPLPQPPLSEELNNKEHRFYAPPSPEEEAFLIKLGWNRDSKASILTDEEVAEFKAGLMDKEVVVKRESEENKRVATLVA